MLSHLKTRKFVLMPIMACHMLPPMSLHAHFSFISAFLQQQRTLLLTLKKKKVQNEGEKKYKMKEKNENPSLAAFQSLTLQLPGTAPS